MKKSLTITMMLAPLFLLGQSLNENPYLTYFLGHQLYESSLGSIGGRTYDGMGKVSLSLNLPNNWMTGYYTSHLPISGRFAEANTPFGRSFLNMGNVAVKSTSFDVLGSHFGEIDAGFRGHYSLSKKGNVRTGLLVNYHTYRGEMDNNEDGFLDLSNKNKTLAINGWNFSKGRYRGTVTGYILDLSEQGGETNFNRDSDYLTTNAYGLGLDMRHGGVMAQNEILVDKNKTGNHSIYFDVDTRFSNMLQFYGRDEYKGDETILNIQTGYRFKKGLNKGEIGVRYRNEKINEIYADANVKNTDNQIAGLYTAYETSIWYKIKLKADARIDYHTKEGLQANPTLQVTYSPITNMGISLFGGTGVRRANVFTEYSRYLFNNKHLLMEEEFDLETAAYYGLSFRYHHNGIYTGIGGWDIRHIRYDGLLNHTIYQSLVLPVNTGKFVSFENHDGKAYKVSLSNRLMLSPYRNLDMLVMHRYDLFKSDVTGTMEEQLYRPRHSFLLSFNYHFRNYVYLGTSYHLVGKVNLPTWSETPESPRNHRWDMSVTVPLKPYLQKAEKLQNFNIVLGVNNITNFKQNNPIRSAEHPFSHFMDGGQAWGSPVGSRFFGGIRVQL